MVSSNAYLPLSQGFSISRLSDLARAPITQWKSVRPTKSNIKVVNCNAVTVQKFISTTIILVYTHLGLAEKKQI